jgi:peptidyl-prolyl cis-trans isomerase D
MLKFFSQRKRARNVFLIFFSIMMVLSLVILYTPAGQAVWRKVTTGSSEVLADEEAVVAEVGDEKITVAEYRQQLNQITRQYSRGGFQDLSFLKAFGSNILDRLIEDRIVLLEGRRLKISATDDEISKQVVPMFRTPSGQFLRDRYFQAIEDSGQTVEQFEEGIRRSITQDKVRSFLTAAVDLSPREVEDDYARTNTSLKLAYVVLKSKDFQDQVKVDEAEARAYFDQHKEEFAIKEIERQVDYVRIPMDRLAVTISDKELQEEYDRTKSDQTLGATVSQIELPFVADNEDDVRKRAEDLVKRARGDEKTPAEEFAKLGAKSIGTVKKDSKDTSYKQRVFNLTDAQKDVAEPIREEGKFYVLKATSWKRKTLSEAKADLTKKIRERKQRDEASNVADEIKKKIEEVKDIRKVAEEFSKKLGNLPVDKLVQRTGFFAASDDLEEFGSYSSSFTSSASSLEEVGAVGSKIYLEDGYAVPQLVAKREPHPAQFDEVKDRVIKKLKATKADEMTKQTAQKLIADSPNVDALKRAAKTAKLDAKTHDDFKWGSTLTDLERSEELDGFAFNLDANRVCSRPIKIGDDLVVFGVSERKNPDLTKLAAERDSIRERLLSTKRDRFFRSYLETVRKKLETEGRITVHQEVADAVFDSSGPGAMPRMPIPGRR